MNPRILVLVFCAERCIKAFSMSVSRYVFEYRARTINYSGSRLRI